MRRRARRWSAPAESRWQTVSPAGAKSRLRGLRKGLARVRAPVLAQGLRKGLAPALLLVLALTVPAGVRALDAAEMFDDPAREARARDIGRELRCLVCQNESIFDSNAGLARDLRVLVRERMDAGDSDTEVIAFIHDRYGDFVLLKPRLTGQTLVLWGAPVIFLLLGAAGVLAYHRGRRRAPAAAALSDAERREARRLLQGGDL